jgi:predicted PurR-regulated permease PerM
MERLFSPIQQLLITWLLVLVTGWLSLNALTYFGELLSVLVTAGLIAFLLNYPVARLQRLWPGGSLPRGIAAAVVYLLAGVGLVVVGIVIAPPILNQAQQLLNNLPNLVSSGQEQLQQFQASRPFAIDLPLVGQQLLNQLEAQTQTIASKGIGLVVGTFNWVLDLILILVISFYLVLDGAQLWQTVTSIFAPPIQERLTLSAQDSLQRFASGQLLLGLFMAVSLSLAFWWLQVPFFLVFALFIGVMEILPFIGATLGIAVVVGVVVFIDGWLALQVLGIAVGIQQIKDNLLAPRVMGELTGLSPVIIFVSLLIGARVGGLLGVILAIPLTNVIKTITEIIFDPTLPPQTGSLFSETMEDSIVEPILLGEEGKHGLVAASQEKLPG